MEKFKITQNPSSQINEYISNLSKIYLNDIELILPIVTIFCGHNLEGKYIKGYDLNGELLFKKSLPIKVEEITIIEYTFPIKLAKIQWTI